MERPHPVHWLAEHGRTGLRELPSNLSWLVSQAREPVESTGSAAESAVAGARDRAGGASATFRDIAPVGDSVETRMKRGRAAAERARDAGGRHPRGGARGEGARGARPRDHRRATILAQ